MICTSMSSARSGSIAGRGPNGARRRRGRLCVADGGEGTGLAMTEATCWPANSPVLVGITGGLRRLRGPIAPIRRRQAGRRTEVSPRLRDTDAAGYLVSRPGDPDDELPTLADLLLTRSVRDDFELPNYPI